MNLQQMKQALLRVLKLEEGGEEEDLVNLALSASLSSIESYIGYQTTYGEYDEVHDVKGSVVYLDYAPVNAISSITVDSRPASVGDYKVLKQKGIIFLSNSATVASVKYTGGYNVYPFDLAYAIVNYAAMMYRAKDFIGVSSEKLGDYSVSYDLEIPAHIQSVLGRYRRV